jgi:Phytanoyl-CoA dioxygenase (PhyH)
MLKGSIDAVHNGQCYGWAMDTDLPTPIEVEIFIDGYPIGQVMADGYRADLEQAGLRGGRLAFCIEVPEPLRDGRHHRIEAHTVDGRLIVVSDAVQLVPKLTVAEFDRHAPWIDSDESVFRDALDTLKHDGGINAEDKANLRFFREHGWLRLEQAVDHGLINQLLEDVESAWSDLPPQLVWRRGLDVPISMREIADALAFREASVRYLDFHNVSEAAAEIMMLPKVLRFAGLCFGEKIAAMQTLLFENGSQQTEHQDFAYVHSLRPACLMGAWVALEDAGMEAGPLFYWDRSHRMVPKYVFEDGSVLASGYGPQVPAFSKYLEQACRDLNLERMIFTPRKGDLLIWHTALVHGGMPRNDPSLSRRSIVSHYTTQAAYPYDRRTPREKPLAIERNGGIYYGARRAGHIENRYTLRQNSKTGS